MESKIELKLHFHAMILKIGKTTWFRFCSKGFQTLEIA